MRKTQLPQYVQRAITSRTAQTEEYARLTLDQWQDLADYLYSHQFIPNRSIGRTVLSKGFLSQTNRGIKKTLDALLSDAVVEHSSVASKVPHYRKVAELYKSVNPRIIY